MTRPLSAGTCGWPPFDDLSPPRRSEDKPMWRGHSYFPALTGEDAVFFPSTHQAADGVQSGACHVRYVLASDRNVHLDPMLDFAGYLGDQPQQGAGNALFHLLGGHFDEHGLHVVQPPAERGLGLGGEAVIAGELPLIFHPAAAKVLSSSTPFGAGCGDHVQREVCRRLVTEGRMGAVCVVVSHPVGNDGTSMSRAAEHGFFQPLIRCPAGDAYIAKWGASGR